jgi:hypothetical protein
VRLVIESLWSQSASECQRLCHPPRHNHRGVVWCRYDTRTLYHTYDVTKLLVSGSNVLGLHIGKGWYGMWGYGNPTAKAVLRITSSDGAASVVSFLAAVLAEIYLRNVCSCHGNIETQRTRVGKTVSIETDASWNAGASPISMDSEYNGETYDARNETAGWDTPACIAACAAKFTPVRIFSHSARAAQPVSGCTYFMIRTESATEIPLRFCSLQLRAAPSQVVSGAAAAPHLGNASLSSASFAAIDVMHRFTAKWMREPKPGGQS